MALCRLRLICVHCENCLTGDFINCMFDPGVQVCSKLLAIDDSDSESDSDNEFEEDDVEEQLIRGTCILELLECEKFIALFSPPSANELFYICIVLDFGIATSAIVDIYHHGILEGHPCIKCQYLEKDIEKKNKIMYKLLPDEVYVLPPQVMSPLVPMSADLSVAEYQWLSDMI